MRYRDYHRNTLRWKAAVNDTWRQVPNGGSIVLPSLERKRLVCVFARRIGPRGGTCYDSVHQLEHQLMKSCRGSACRQIVAAFGVKLKPLKGLWTQDFVHSERVVAVEHSESGADHFSSDVATRIGTMILIHHQTIVAEKISPQLFGDV